MAVRSYTDVEQRCTLCGRSMPAKMLTEHHLVPREEGGKPEHKVPMCKPCHGHIHATYDNRTLALSLNTIDALRRDEKIGRFVRFIRKQSPTTLFRSSYSAGRRGKKR